MDYKEQERQLRHKMCVALALETLLICLITIWMNLGVFDPDNTVIELYYHEVELDWILGTEFWIICFGTIILTALSIRFKWVYRIYECIRVLFIVYFVSREIVFTEEYIILGIVIAALSGRFILYLILLGKIRKKREE